MKLELGTAGYFDYGLVICQANGRPLMTEHPNKRKFLSFLFYDSLLLRKLPFLVPQAGGHLLSHWSGCFYETCCFPCSASYSQGFSQKKTAPSSILTLSVDSEVETQESREDLIWHELQNAYRTRKILTGNLGGIERMDGGGTIAVIYYKEMRVVIPLAEIMINVSENAAHDYGELVQRQNMILGNAGM